MKHNVREIFRPSTGVDLVFDTNSPTPYARASIIYDADHRNSRITIAQPRRIITRNTEFEELHLTTIVNTIKRKIRVGIACEPVQFMKEYRLAGFETVQALALEYDLPIVEMNIRSAFRMPLTGKYVTRAKLVYKEQDFITSKDYHIKEMSLSGLSIVFRRKKGKVQNPLSAMKVKEDVIFGMILIDTEQDKKLGTVPLQAQIVRVNPNYSDTHTRIGLKITRLTDQGEDLLSRFIHDAQIEELKRYSGRSM